MDLIGLVSSISSAMAIFQEAQTTVDPQALLLAEYTFLTQELEMCHKNDRDSIGYPKDAYHIAFIAVSSHYRCL